MNGARPDGRRFRRKPERPRPVRVDAYGGVTYYDRPVVKHSPWGWEVGAYIFVGGLSGGSQIIATIAQLRDRAGSTGMVRNARFLATVGSAVGAALLVVDLRTPHRWYNMLRIFRPTSPMSIGTYILTTFAAASAVGAFGELSGGGRMGQVARSVADVAQFPAALSGAGLSTYTAALLASTSTPLWAASSLPLAGHFGASAMADGAAALSLGEQWGGRPDTSARLDDLALLASVADAAFTLAADRRVHARGVGGNVDGPDRDALGTAGVLAVGCALPIACHLLNRFKGRRSPTLSVVASLAILAGSFIAKSSVIKAGNQSADRPRDYFRLAQRRNLPELETDRRSAAREPMGEPA